MTYLYFTSICPSQTCIFYQWSTAPELLPSWYPTFILFANFPFQAWNTPHQNCSPFLYVLSHSIFYPDFMIADILMTIEWPLVLDIWLYALGMTLNSSVVVLSMTLNSCGAIEEMIFWVSLQFAPRCTDDFPVWSCPTCCVASLRAGPVGCILYNM